MRGMPEPEVRAALPGIRCAEEDPVDPRFDYCSVSKGESPGDEGEITFKDGFVHSATRNWFFDEAAEPLKVLMMVHEILTRLIGEDQAACAKIETWSFQDPNYTMFALPEKVLIFQLHKRDGKVVAGHLKESLRINPVPSNYKTRGKIMQGTDWCAYVH